MKALVKTAPGPGNVQVLEKGIPSIPEDDWVLIQVKAAGVCGTDLHIWHDEYPNYPPVVLGHEFSGQVVECGRTVSGWRPGDRVVVEPHSLACGACELCRSGKLQSCASKRSPGWGIDGAFADYVVVPSVLLHSIPDSISYDLAALAEPVAICVTALYERIGVGCQDIVVVTGPGPIGIIAALVAKSAGASKVVVVGLNSCERKRFGVAKMVAADYLINSDKDDPVQAVMDLTNGRGADLVIEASGSQQAASQGIQMAKNWGRVCGLGLGKKDMILLPWNEAAHKNLEIKFSMSSSVAAWNRAVTLISREQSSLRHLITRRTVIDNWEEVFHDLEAEKEVKVLFEPEAS